VSHPVPHTFGKTCRFRRHTDRVFSVSFSPDGERIVSGSKDKSVLIWDLRTQKIVMEPLRDHTDCVNSVAYSPDGEKIVSGSDDHSALVWNARSGKRIRKLTMSNPIHSVGFNPDSSMIASDSQDGTIRIWDSTTGQNIHSLFLGDTPLSLAFSPNGQYLVLGTNSGVNIWEVESWKKARDCIDKCFVRDVAVSPDSNHVAYSRGQNVCVMDMKTGNDIAKLKGHTNKVTCLAFSPDGTWIASGSWDKTIRIWETATGNLILTLEFSSFIYSIAISLDGMRITAGCNDNNIYLYSYNSVV